MNQKESHNIVVDRYYDHDGNPTCAINFPCGEVCKFYRTQRMGCNETCVFANNVNGYMEVLNRRGNAQEGSLIPLPYCPIWENKI